MRPLNPYSIYPGEHDEKEAEILGIENISPLERANLQAKHRDVSFRESIAYAESLNKRLAVKYTTVARLTAPLDENKRVRYIHFSILRYTSIYTTLLFHYTIQTTVHFIEMLHCTNTL